MNMDILVWQCPLEVCFDLAKKHTGDKRKQNLGE
jgi:hypothetical protein